MVFTVTVSVLRSGPKFYVKSMQLELAMRWQDIPEQAALTEVQCTVLGHKLCPLRQIFSAICV